MLQPTRNYAFIDGNNLHMAVRDLGWRIDHRKFRVFLREQGKLRCLLAPNSQRYSGLLKKAAGSAIAFVDPLRAKLEFTEKKSTR